MNFCESQTIELKQIWRDEYLKTICAFANSEGGKLYIGVCDNGEVVGVEDRDILLETLPNKINNRLGLLVDITSQNISNKDIIVVEVKRSYAPISYNGKFYKRSGSNTIELNSSNLTNFLLKKYGKTWDDIIEGNLIDQVDKIMDILRVKYLKAYIS